MPFLTMKKNIFFLKSAMFKAKNMKMNCLPLLSVFPFFKTLIYVMFHDAVL